MITDKTESRKYGKTVSQREKVLDELKKNGFRITNQRKLLIDIILSDECSCCKEIYYEAVRQDSSIGIATVYRMVKTLEDIGAINRKNMYKIDCGVGCGLKKGCTLILDNQEKVSLSGEDLHEAMMGVLRKRGYGKCGKIESISFETDNVYSENFA